MSLSFINQNLSTFSATDIETVIEPRNLRSINLSHNNFTDMNFLCSPITGVFAFLESLDISNNNIKQLPVMMTSSSSSAVAKNSPNSTNTTVKLLLPPQLRKLDISHNFIQSLFPIHSLEYLISLKASHNALTTLVGPVPHHHHHHHHLPQRQQHEQQQSQQGNNRQEEMLMMRFPRDLASLDLSHNGITSFDGALNNLTRLHTLHVEHNDLASVEDVVSQVSALPQLRYLHVLEANPITSGSSSSSSKTNQHDVKQSIVSACASLRTLDGSMVRGYSGEVTNSPFQELTNNISENSNNQNNNNNNKSNNCRSAVSSNNTTTNNNNSARDERRRCQALRELLQQEMQQESALKVNVDQLQKQVRQEKAVQRSQLTTLGGLRSECEQAQLEVENLKLLVAEAELEFLQQHAEAKNQRVRDAASPVALASAGKSSSKSSPATVAVTPAHQVAS